MRSFRMAAVVVPFASAGMGGTAYLVTRAVASFLQVASYLPRYRKTMYTLDQPIGHVNGQHNMNG